MTSQKIANDIKIEVKKSYNFLYSWAKKYSDKDVRSAFFELSYISLYSHYRNFYTGIDFNQFYEPFKEIPHNNHPEHLNTIFKNYYHSSNFMLMIRVYSSFELSLNLICDKCLNEKNKNELLNIDAEKLKKDLKNCHLILPDNIYNKHKFKSLSRVPFLRKLRLLLKQQEKELSIERKEILNFFECLMHYRNSIHTNFVYQGNEDKHYEIEYNNEIITFNFKNNEIVQMASKDEWLGTTHLVGKTINYANLIYESLQYHNKIIDPSYEIFKFKN
ncbi:hypothetical protein [Aureibaculum marinum]|nr:hypothetical protein [Aureibaculum marinum]